MQCVVCKEFLPPGFTEPIPDTKYHKCKFCKEGKDEILTVSSISGEMQWDIKKKIVYEYKQYLNEIAKNQKKRETFIKGIL